MFGLFKRKQQPKDNKRPNLLAVNWAIKDLDRKLKEKDASPLTLLFPSFMYGVGSFPVLDISETALFELGCFALSAIDLWIFTNKRELQGHISNKLIENYAVLYASIFEARNGQKIEIIEIGQILESRILDFGNILRISSMDFDRATNALAEVMMFSQNQTKPLPYTLEKGKVELQAFREFELKTSIQGWLSNIFPRIIDSVKMACDQFEKDYIQ
jgi:hypothetical protein